LPSIFGKAVVKMDFYGGQYINKWSQNKTDFKKLAKNGL
jgi:hypothetical protein